MITASTLLALRAIKGGADAANLSSLRRYGGKPALEDINLTLESGELRWCWGRPAAVKPPC